MFSDVKIIEALNRERHKFREEGDLILREANNILHQEQFNEKNILRNLKSYNQTFELLDEEGLDKSHVYGLREIKAVCIKYNLRFLDSQLYKGEFPAEAIFSIKELQKHNKTPFKNFKVLGPKEVFRTKNLSSDPMLFAETKQGNYYLVHQWNHSVKWYSSLLQFPFRRFENLIVTLLISVLLITAIIPNSLLVMGKDFGYWDTHRIAAFFHILIIVSGLTVFLCFAFHKNFSSNVWDDNRY